MRSDLETVPKAFLTPPREFNVVSQVANIFASDRQSNSNKHIQQVLQSWEVMELAMDSIGDYFYKGFNTSLKHSSEILEKLDSSLKLVKTLQSNVDSLTPLFSHSIPKLEKTYNDFLSMDFIIKPYKLVWLIQSVPKQFQKFLDGKMFLHATTLLVDTVALLHKPTLKDIQALSQIKPFIHQQMDNLPILLINEIESLLYSNSVPTSEIDSFSKNSSESLKKRRIEPIEDPTNYLFFNYSMSDSLVEQRFFAHHFPRYTTVSQDSLLQLDEDSEQFSRENSSPFVTENDIISMGSRNLEDSFKILVESLSCINSLPFALDTLSNNLVPKLKRLFRIIDSSIRSRSPRLPVGFNPALVLFLDSDQFRKTGAPTIELVNSILSNSLVITKRYQKLITVCHHWNTKVPQVRHVHPQSLHISSKNQIIDSSDDFHLVTERDLPSPKKKNLYLPNLKILNIMDIYSAVRSQLQAFLSYQLEFTSYLSIESDSEHSVPKSSTVSKKSKFFPTISLAKNFNMLENLGDFNMKTRKLNLSRIQKVASSGMQSILRRDKSLSSSHNVEFHFSHPESQQVEEKQKTAHNSLSAAYQSENLISFLSSNNTFTYDVGLKNVFLPNKSSHRPKNNNDFQKFKTDPFSPDGSTESSLSPSIQSFLPANQEDFLIDPSSKSSIDPNRRRHVFISSPYVVSLLYRPIVTFSVQFERLLKLAPIYSLQQFLNDFFLETFLPQLKTDYTDLFQRAMESHGSWRIHERNLATYKANQDEFRPLLRGIKTVYSLIQRLFAYATEMNFYIEEIYLVIEKILLFLLQSCNTRFQKIIQESLLKDLIPFVKCSTGENLETYLANPENNTSTLVDFSAVQLLNLSYIHNIRLTELEKILPIASLVDSLFWLSEKLISNANALAPNEIELKNRRNSLNSKKSIAKSSAFRTSTLISWRSQHNTEGYGAVSASLRQLAAKFTQIASKCLFALKLYPSVLCITSFSPMKKVYSQSLEKKRAMGQSSFNPEEYYSSPLKSTGNYSISEPDAYVQQMCKKLTLFETELFTLLPQYLVSYCFKDLGELISQLFVLLGNNIKTITTPTRSKMQTNIFTIQQTLSSIGIPLAEIEVSLEKAKSFFAH